MGSYAQVSAVQLLSGLENGTYNELANNIKSSTTVPVNVLTSKGAVENLDKILADNTIDLAFMQYDVLTNFAKSDQQLRQKLMIFLPLFLDEEIHVIVRKDSKMKLITDLQRKKVGVGSAEQGTAATAKIVKEQAKLEWVDVAINSNDAMTELLKGNIDAFFYVGGAPISMLQNLPDETKKQIRLLDLQTKTTTIDCPLKTIKSGTYDWHNGEVKTYAVTMLLVMNAKPSKITEMYLAQIRKDIMKEVQKLQTEGHPKWKNVYYRNEDIKWPYYYFGE